MRGAIVLVIAVRGLVSSGCGDGSLRTLTPADVSNIPAGNATGTLFSGRYTLTRAWKGPCRCRVGSCATLTIDPNLGTLTVVQADGTFSFSNDNRPSLTCDGGIDSDGSFICGQFDPFSGDASTSLTTGQITLANGQPASMHGIGETTTSVPGFECDLQVGFEGTFVGP